MTLARLIRQSLLYYWRTHLGIVAGTLVGAAVLIGALTVGDSVRGSLRDQALARIGRAEFALTSHDRFFLEDLAERMEKNLPDRELTPVLHVGGIASARGGEARAIDVQVFGVRDEFFKLAPEDFEPPALERGRTFLNERLAHQLGVEVGDSVLLKVEQPSAMPRDMVLSTSEDLSTGLRVRVEAILDGSQFGRFALNASGLPPFNAFVDLDWLQEQLEQDDRANMLLSTYDGSDADPGSLEQALSQVFTLDDGELMAVEEPDSTILEILSDRVFVDAPVLDAFEQGDVPTMGVLTYFVNEIRLGDKATPYSMIAALGDVQPGATVEGTDWKGLVGDDVSDEEIVLNTWLAEDLGAKPGDTLSIKYFMLGERRRLEERQVDLKVHSVIELEGLAIDQTLVPEFPGITDSDNCRDWEPGIPVDLGLIRDKDETYWDDYRGTPKGFVTLATGQKLWGNRFGSVTSMRVPKVHADEARDLLKREVDPAHLGLFFLPLRENALLSSSSATDFAGLFIGLSFFLIIAAALLTAILFVFGIEQRADQIGTFLAIGFRPGQVKRLLLLEGLGLAIIGSALGTPLGIAYTQAVLDGLSSVWKGAVGATAITLHIKATTLTGGFVGSVLVAVFALWLSSRQQVRRPAVELMRSRSGVSTRSRGDERRRIRIALVLALLGLVGTLGIVVAVDSSQGELAAPAFFGAGSLLLIAWLATSKALLSLLGRTNKPLTTLSGLGIRSASRRPGRSLATIALLACGSFLVVAVGAFHMGPARDVYDRSTGTGGFALIARSTLPVLHDPLSDQGLEAYGFDEGDLDQTQFVPFRVREGDDASCLNLGLTRNPQLLGVTPELLAERGAFSFAATEIDTDGSPWDHLNRDLGPDEIPAIGDDKSVTWALHKSIGDTLDYWDERGRPFRVRIVATVANSILQGNLLISERDFEQRFPTESGYRLFLIDTPKERREAVTVALTQGLEDVGIEVGGTGERLSEFNAVQNTYLVIFQLLGGLGLLLGSVGLGMVVLRNVLERRSELAILRAMGYRARIIRWLVLSEHGMLLGAGLIGGTVAAWVAIQPALRGPQTDGSVTPTATLLGLVALSGAFWVFLATFSAIRGSLIEALRSD